MGKTILKYATALLLLLFVSCAKRGNITGGAKDTIAPVLKASFPKNFSTDFKSNTIKLTFDEFIKLKDLKKQLIISPPMKNEPLIIPSTPSKIITIAIKDTLQENTTYSFNFGQGITDNNEGNALNQFKYVFSLSEIGSSDTGAAATITSLSTSCIWLANRVVFLLSSNALILLSNSLILSLSTVTSYLDKLTCNELS
jgi:hypothetical protein